VHIAEAERVASLPTSERLAFSAKVLALFVILGPAIATVGTGVTSGDVARNGYVLLVAYVPGIFLALFSWVLFSLAFALFHAITRRLPFASKLWSAPLQIGAGAIIGAVSGYVVVGLFTCSAAAWVTGGWLPCMQLLLSRDYGLSVVPGLVCGAASVLLVSKHVA
jgi:hypothetical protein